MRLALDQAHALVVETLTRCRTGAANAAHVAAALVAAELAGQAGHGLRRVPSYAGQALTGKVDGFAEPVARQTRPGALMVDAAHGFAYPALALAMDWLPGAARAQGVAVAGVRRSHHAGVTGWFVERLARDGLAALMFANTPAAMAPWGGREALFGTNPVAFAAPVTGAEPIVVDLSLSTAARGKIMAAAQQGEPIPEGWATDADGRPTTDARAALKGMMQPAGGAKGAALALMVEVLAAGLTGATLAADAGSFFEPQGAPPGTGQLLLAIDPAALGGADAAARIATLAAAFEGNGEARLPGRRRQQTAARVRAEGIELDDALLAEIRALPGAGQSSAPISPKS
ncbi:MAG TPA: Ldh family oxidoreductase [Paracoccaceae bacterium]|nr:Ldh family oxidoreductase [Paracoccaceae bacterium]